MSYFTEVSDYQTYANNKEDFHFSYNANSGGGQSFLGGQFIDKKGVLSSPTVLDDHIGIFEISFKDERGQDRHVVLNDEKGQYKIKPRGVGSSSMKLGVGTTMVSPSKLVSSFFMLPPTCTIKAPNNLENSILTTNNFWLQSMWLKCDLEDSSTKVVQLIPLDFIYCGGSNKDNQGESKYFKLEEQKRVSDILILSNNLERIPASIRQYITLFSNIYSGLVPFKYDICINAVKNIMTSLAKEFPDGFSGIEDPLPFLMSLLPSSVRLPQRNLSRTSKSYSKYHTALRTKPFMLLAGISGTGKSRIVRKLAQASVTEELQRQYDPKSVAGGFNRWELHKPANFELIQVKPNWHNSLEVVGYKSNIGGSHYEFTPFVEFVARAWKHQDVPFFLCLDEMNLAPVEQYFAEFLSAIESRSIENGEYETDPIIKPFIEFGEEVCNMMINHLVGKVDASKVVPDSIESKLVERFKTKGLTLPKNLLVMGTVNMDETTFSFSRKVLDRAMSVVMNEVEYDKFFSGESENDVEEMNDNIRGLLIDRPIRGLEAENNEAEEVEKYLTNINEKLNDTPFKLGYRAANEALLYVSAARQFNADADIHAALDEFTMMKILSRIEGDKRSIGSLLEDLKEVITTDYPKSNEKLGKMAKTLENKQFVSYWT